MNKSTHKKASPCTLPAGSLLLPYQAKGDFTDCFLVDIEGLVSLAQFVSAFYRTRLFRMERTVLQVTLGKSSSDEQVAALASADTDRFAAWTVETREPQQLLLCDYRGQTRSWLMAHLPEPETARSGNGHTTLYFGSAIIAKRDPATGERSMSPGFKSLLGLHTMYSKALLNAAKNLLLKESN